jgi:PAS domain S-box-containing protein
MTEGDIVAARRAFQDLLLECTEDAIVVVDRDGLVVVWNRGAERMYGWAAGEIVGRHVPSFVPMHLGEEERPELRREATVERKDDELVDQVRRLHCGAAVLALRGHGKTVPWDR